jgi:hypothetical protein
VEGRDRKARVAAPKTVSESLTEIARRFAREREDEQFLGARPLLVNQPNGALDNDARLARARAGQDDCWAIAVGDGGLLIRIEMTQRLG